MHFLKLFDYKLRKNTAWLLKIELTWVKPGDKPKKTGSSFGSEAFLDQNPTNFAVSCTVIASAPPTTKLAMYSTHCVYLFAICFSEPMKLDTSLMCKQKKKEIAPLSIL